MLNGIAHIRPHVELLQIDSETTSDMAEEKVLMTTAAEIDSRRFDKLMKLRRRRVRRVCKSETGGSSPRFSTFANLRYLEDQKVPCC